MCSSLVFVLRLLCVIAALLDCYFSILLSTSINNFSTTAQADNRVRAWYTEDMELGLLYKCALGDIAPDSPLGAP